MHRIEDGTRMGVVRGVILLVFALFIDIPLGNGTDGESAANEVRLSVKGLRIVAQPYNDEQSVRAFNWFSGTTLAIQVEVPSGGLVELNSRASKLESMVDDTGRDLVRLSSKSSFSSHGIGSFPAFSDDGRVAMVEISAPGIPSRDATKIGVTGTLVFRQATIKKTVSQAVELRENTTINAGPMVLTLTKVGKPDWGSEPLGITLRATEDTAAIADIRFLAADGSPLESRKAGTATQTGAFDRVTVDMAFAIKEKVDRVTVEIDYWQDMSDLAVPLSVKSSLGIE